jgi:hypothetical protein
MSDQAPPVISSAVEGLVDEAVVKRLILESGGKPGPVFGKNGKSHLKKQINGFNQAARLSPWLILLDLNHEFDCAPPLKSDWLPRPSPLMCFRVAVREVEAWLLADRKRFASFFQIPLSIIPTDPESIDNPKELVVGLAGKSGNRAIRDDMIPRLSSGRSVGPGYISRLIEFVFDARKGWRPQHAACSSDSLKRCLNRLQELAARVRSDLAP